MRNWVVGILAGVAGMAVGAALVVVERYVHAVPLPPPTAQQASLPPVPEVPQAAPEPEPTPPAAPDLPTVEVAPHIVHTVPDEDTPAPKATIFDRNGREITSRGNNTPPPSYVPSPSPMPPGSSASASRGPLILPQFAAKPSAPSAGNFSGSASAPGGIALTVGGRQVALFGVRPGDARDRCGLGPGDARACADVARDALAQRLQRNANVDCRIPPGQRGNPAAVCTDNSGTDLGGFLVAEGLALADTGTSYEYFGAEGVARSFRRGLWRNR